MHEPASKKLLAPLPSKACRKKSTRIVRRSFSHPCQSAQQSTHFHCEGNRESVYPKGGDKVTHGGIATVELGTLETGDVFEDEHEWRENARDLRVLVNEHQRIRNIVIA